MKVVYPRIDRPSTTSLLCRFAQQELPGFEFSSIQVNKARWTAPEMEVQVDLQKFLEDYKAAMHVDKNNLGPSYIIGLGDSSIFIDSSVFFLSDICCSWRRLFWRLAVAGWWQQIGSGQKHQEPARNGRKWTQVDASGRKWTQVNEFEDVHIWILIFTKSQDSVALRKWSLEEQVVQIWRPEASLCRRPRVDPVSEPQKSAELLRGQGDSLQWTSLHSGILASVMETLPLWKVHLRTLRFFFFFKGNKLFTDSMFFCVNKSFDPWCAIVACHSMEGDIVCLQWTLPPSSVQVLRFLRFSSRIRIPKWQQRCHRRTLGDTYGSFAAGAAGVGFWDFLSRQEQLYLRELGFPLPKEARLQSHCGLWW